MQDRIAEFEIHKEMHVHTAFDIFEMPPAVHMTKGTIQILGINALFAVRQRHFRPEAFTKYLKADHQIGQHHPLLTLLFFGTDARGGAPGQKFRIGCDVGNKIVHLLRSVRQRFRFSVGRHDAPFHRDSGAGCRMLGAKNQGQDVTMQPYVIDEMISAKAIAARIEALAQEIAAEYSDTDKLVVVGLLRGSFVFIADLVRELSLPVEVDFLEVSSYGDAMESSREVRVLKDLRSGIEGRDVLVVEDIVDTGFTLSHVIKMLQNRTPHKLRTIALLDKPSRREVDVRADWTGFEIPDEFVVGYGIDFAQRNRNLPFIGKVRFTETD